jgi:hypothetical protein
MLKYILEEKAKIKVEITKFEHRGELERSCGRQI